MSVIPVDVGAHGPSPHAAPALATWEIYGVTVAAPFPLRGARAVKGHEPDITIEVGERSPVGDERPPGKLLLDAVVNGTRLYAVSRDETGCHLRIAGFGNLDFDELTGALRCHLGPTADLALLEVFLTGMVPALWLYLHNEVVLHASTVTAGRTTVAIVGRSGMGKSTFAALLCAGGATLVGDDVLCVGVEEGDVRWRGRSLELRLRPGAAEMAEDYLSGSPRRRTVDGRVAVTPPATASGHGTLGVIIIPVPVPGLADPSVRRVPPLEALTRLAACPRLVGWQDQEVLRRQFVGTAKLVSAVPVLEVRLPWGPPFAEGLARKLLGCVLATVKGLTDD